MAAAAVMDKARDIAPHGFVSLREYVDVQFAAIKEAVSKAETATERRFEGVNEFRAQLADQTRTLMPRLEAEQKFKSQDEKQAVIEARINGQENRGRGRGELMGYIFAAIGAAALILSIALRFVGK
jgi:hypothetical protein